MGKQAVEMESLTNKIKKENRLKMFLNTFLKSKMKILQVLALVFM